MFAIRNWSVRQARALETFYRYFAATLTALHPLWRRIGYPRLQRPVTFIERHIKGALFDCKMCGNCILGSTGMACPMNCPKQLRNGPCGGVRADGNCEVLPTMRCVWVAAYDGSQRMQNGDKILALQPAVDWSAQGTSSWLREAQATATTPNTTP